MVETTEQDGLNDARFPHPILVVLFALEFTFVNSTLEELFWRVFLYRELGSSLVSGGLQAPDGEVEQKPMVICGQTIPRPDPRSEKCKILLAFYYAAYHFVVVILYMPWYIAVAAVIGLTVAGRFLMLCRETEKFGLLTGIGCHAGADAAVCLILVQMYTRFV